MLFAILHSHKQCSRVLISLRPQQRLSFSWWLLLKTRWREVLSHCVFDLHFSND